MSLIHQQRALRAARRSIGLTSKAQRREMGAEAGRFVVAVNEMLMNDVLTAAKARAAEDKRVRCTAEDIYAALGNDAHWFGDLAPETDGLPYAKALVSTKQHRKVIKARKADQLLARQKMRMRKAEAKALAARAEVAKGK